MTGNVRAVRLKNKVETLGDVVGLGNLERRARNGHVADQAINQAAGELNRSRHQYRVARDRASFHETRYVEILRKLGSCVEFAFAQRELPPYTPKKNRTRPVLH